MEPQIADSTSWSAGYSLTLWASKTVGMSTAIQTVTIAQVLLYLLESARVTSAMKNTTKVSSTGYRVRTSFAKSALLITCKPT